MTPFEQAQDVYNREPCARTFATDLFLHLQNGYVFSGPSFFVMLRPVDSSAAVSLVIDPAHVFDLSTCDAWLIYLMAGDMAEAWGHFPFPLPKIGFEKRNRLRYYGFQFLQEQISTSRRRGAVSASNTFKTAHLCTTSTDLTSTVA